MAFKSLNLNATILKALHEQGYETPTPIQAKAIPPILEGKDVLGCAQTGTGKTAAFALPVIQRLSEMPVDKTKRGAVHPRALILSPTRELAAQIGESFGTYGKNSGLSHAVIFGGVSQHHQVKAIHRGVDVLVATPGRLMDLMDQRIVTLKDVKVFILDEADRMLDMGFIQPIRRIAAAVPGGRQTLLFSATMPREIMHLADSLLKNPVKVSVAPVASTASLITQSVYQCAFHNKQALLELLLEEPGVDRAVVFTRTKHGADRVCQRLERDGIAAVAIHGNKAQNYRTRALDSFKSGKTRVLVATDVAARGLDVDNITHVFNFDLPMEPEAYVHRIGRTGRAGASGIAISFCDRAEFDQLRQIERLTGKQIPRMETPVLPTNDHQREEREGRTPYRPDRRESRPQRSAPSGPSHGRPPRGEYGERPFAGRRDSHAPRGAAFPSPSHAPRADHGHASKPHAPAPHSHAARAPHASHSASTHHAPAARPAPATPHAPRPAHAPAASHGAHAPHPQTPRPGHHASPKKPHRKGAGPNTRPSTPPPAHGHHRAAKPAHGAPRAKSGAGHPAAHGHPKKKSFTQRGPARGGH
jgi:ATP-dependent RNA helicase RhlE